MPTLWSGKMVVWVIEWKILGVLDLLRCKVIAHKTCIDHVHKNRMGRAWESHGTHTDRMHGNHMGHIQIACTRIAQDVHVGSSMKRKTPVFPSMFFNEWILISEHPDHMYEFQISRSLFYNAFWSHYFSFRQIKRALGINTFTQRDLGYGNKVIQGS